jgi:hypothetical protein
LAYYLNKKEPVDVEPEDGGKINGHGHDGEQPLVEDELVHLASLLLNFISSSPAGDETG